MRLPVRIMGIAFGMALSIVSAGVALADSWEPTVRAAGKATLGPAPCQGDCDAGHSVSVGNRQHLGSMTDGTGNGRSVQGDTLLHTWDVGTVSTPIAQAKGGACVRTRPGGG